MNIESPRFGTLNIEPSKIIEFPQGLAGFETSRRFSLFHPEDVEDAKFFILQSVDDPVLAFKLVDPALLGFSYEIELSDEETGLLKMSDPQDISVVVIVWRDNSDKNMKGPLRANLKAPLVINTKERRGLQHIFLDLNCTVPTDADSTSAEAQ